MMNINQDAMHKEPETKEINSSVNTPARESYKQTKLGWIPEDWKLIKLGNIFQKIIGGGTPSKSNLDYWNGKIPWSTVKDLSSFNEYSTQQYISDIGLKNSSANLIPPSTIITATRMLLGVAVKYKIAVAINQDLKALFTNDKVDDNFLLQWFKKYQKKINYLGSGSTVKGISLTAFKNIKIILPPLPEQQKIAQILSAWDKAIALQEQLITEKQALKKGLIQELLTGKKRFPGFEENWNKIELKEVGKIIRGSSPRPKGDPKYYGGNVPRLMVKDVTRDGKYVTPKIDFLTEAGAKRSRPCKAGTLTVVCSGDVGVPSFLAVDACIHDGFLAIIEIKMDLINSDFLYYQLERLRARMERSATHGGIFTNLTTSILKDFIVEIPTLEEQIKIVNVLSKSDRELEKQELKLNRMLSQKQGLMQQLLTGEKRVKI